MPDPAPDDALDAFALLRDDALSSLVAAWPRIHALPPERFAAALGVSFSAADVLRQRGLDLGLIRPGGEINEWARNVLRARIGASAKAGRK